VDISVTTRYMTLRLNVSKGMLNFIKLGWTLVMRCDGSGGLMGLYFIIRRYWKEFWLTWWIRGSLLFFVLYISLTAPSGVRGSGSTTLTGPVFPAATPSLR